MHVRSRRRRPVTKNEVALRRLWNSRIAKLSGRLDRLEGRVDAIKATLQTLMAALIGPARVPPPAREQ